MSSVHHIASYGVIHRRVDPSACGHNHFTKYLNVLIWNLQYMPPSKQTYIRNVCNAVPVVWGLLRLTPIMSLFGDATHQASFCMHIGHHSQGFKSDFKKVKCVQMQKMLHTIIIVPGAEIKVWFRFMLALHESREKTQSKNPFGGKKAHGKKPKWKLEHFYNSKESLFCSSAPFQVF